MHAIANYSIMLKETSPIQNSSDVNAEKKTSVLFEVPLLLLFVRQ
jgi:hypothetical protein